MTEIRTGKGLFQFNRLLVVAVIAMVAISPEAEATANDYSHQIGSVCSHETQVVRMSPTKGGDLICVKDSSGLHWQNLALVTADTRLSKILPKCGTVRLYSQPIKLNINETKVFNRLINNYFGRQHLLPAKITMVLKAIGKNLTVGTHSCSNGVGGPVGGWGGFMPLNSSAGWQVWVTHKSNIFGNSSFLNIVRTGTTYKIVTS